MEKEKWIEEHYEEYIINKMELIIVGKDLTELDKFVKIMAQDTQRTL